MEAYRARPPDGGDGRPDVAADCFVMLPRGWGTGCALPHLLHPFRVIGKAEVCDRGGWFHDSPLSSRKGVEADIARRAFMMPSGFRTQLRALDLGGYRLGYAALRGG